MGGADQRRSDGRREARYRSPLDADARKVLSQYLEVPLRVRRAIFSWGRGEGGRPLGDLAGGEEVRGSAGLDISPHELRHAYGTRLVREEGVDLVTWAALMEHKSLDTTAICTQPSG